MAVVVTQRGGILYAPTEGQSDEFAYSAALSADGEVLAVGVPGNDSVSSNNGLVYVFDRSGSTWAARGSALQCPDATAGNKFGFSVALSADGLVLAVGAPNQGTGHVYLFDSSGSAWTLRGSGFTGPTDPSAPVLFGYGVALSESGEALAVCSPEQPDSGIHATYKLGVVYVYDRNGTGWDQRGSKIQHPDAASATGDLYWGVSVALSRDGAVLAAGSSEVGAGRIYVYDRSGTAWTLRGATYLASPQPFRSGWGNHLALSDDGTWLASTTVNWGSVISLHVKKWDGLAWVAEASPNMASGYPQYGSAVAMSAHADVMTMGDAGADGAVEIIAGGLYIYDTDIPPPATPSDIEAPAELTVGVAGDVEAPTDLAVGATGDVEAPTTLAVSYPGGDVEAPTELAVMALGDAEAPTELAIVPATHVPNWTARCIIGGVDMSARLVGQASVTAAEGAARIARLVLQPPSGVIEPLDYVGKTITLDYVLVIGAIEVPRRLFTGRVDTPSYDPATTLLTLDCTDDLQNIVAALPRATLDSLTDGRYSAAVQGEIDDNWDYAQALMTTLAASLDASPVGGLRVSAWEPAATWATFGTGAGGVLYQRMQLSLPQRSTLVNKVDIEFDYRFARLRQRYTTLGWSGTQVDMRPNGWQYPTQQDILGAANGSGWTVTLGVFYPAPTKVPHSSGGFIYPEPGAIDMAIVHLAQRHSQTVTEKYRFPVTAPESIEANGELPAALRGALESAFDGSAWESALDVEPLLPTGGEQDYAPDADRAAADYALQTLLDQARVKILGSHRSARVSNAVLCNPDLDLDKKVAIATPACAASGKVAQLVHVLDFAGGSAITEFSIAISGVGGAGIITPDTLAPPAPPDAAIETQDWPGSVPSLFVNTFGGTPYSDNLMGLLLNPPETITVQDVPVDGTVTFPNPYYVAGTYPVQGFRVAMPGVIDADRNPLDRPVAASYQILVPADPLTFTIP